MTNADLLAALRDDGALGSTIVAGIVAVALTAGGFAIAAIRRLRRNRHPHRTPEQEARLIGNLRAEGYRMAGLSEAEWNAYLTEHQLQPKRDRVDRLIDDELMYGDDGEGLPTEWKYP